MTPKQSLSRRELLKAMTALGGSVAASSFWPDKWAKPQVSAGALPAHAQATLCEPTGIECEIGDVTSTPQDEIVVPYTIQLIPPCPGIEVTGSLSAYGVELSESLTISGITDTQGRIRGSETYPPELFYYRFELLVYTPLDCSDEYIAPE